MKYPFLNLLDDFPLISKKGIIYLDSITKTLFPNCLWPKIIDFYNESGVAPRRGAYRSTLYASQELDKTKIEVAKLINSEKENIIFNPNRYLSATTVMLGYPWKSGDKLIVSDMEHHSILVPALMTKRRDNIETITIGRKNNWEFDIETFENKIDRKCKFVILTLSPMVLGVKNPVKEVTKIAHDHGSYVLSDCSRAINNSKINFKELGCDAMIFSGCVGITGLDGVSFLCCKRKLQEKLVPIISGGGAVSEVTTSDFKHSSYPEKLEPGLINMGSIIALREAINYLSKNNLENIRNYNMMLANNFMSELKKIDNIEIYGPSIKEKATPVVSFNITGMNSHDVALFLDDINQIAVRSGMQCSYPLVRSLNNEGVIQVSFHFYNPPEIVDTLIETLNLIMSELS